MVLPNNTLLQGGKYKITRFIASGGFGCTYEAEHVMLRRRVAIKEFFVKDFCNRDEATSHVTVGTQSKTALVSKLMGKFIEEAVSLSTFSHPNIIRVSDVFEENGTAYYVMDFINGKSINAIVQEKGKIPESKAIHYISQIAEALKEVHKQNRLHLDIKPANIMVDEKDNAILIDFGASKQYDEVDGENTSTLVGRTPGYAPLEQLGNDIVKFMPATDIYALGATLYKMLSGNTPISATLLASGEELEPLPSYISENTKSCIQQAMRLNKKQRPQSIDAFLTLLHNNVNKKNSTKTPTKENKRRDPEETQLIFSDHQNQPSMPNCGVCKGHEWVDLGLPSGTKWATCNLGASKPEDFGDYFAWGETSTNLNNRTWACNPFDSLKAQRIIDSSGNLSPKYDSAYLNWGAEWRIPSSTEINELHEKCIWKWTRQGGKNGYRITGPNGESIFLPAAGLMGISAVYWSSTCIDNLFGVAAYGLNFSADYIHLGKNHCDGRYPIRPIINENLEYGGKKNISESQSKNNNQNTSSKSSNNHSSNWNRINDDIKSRFYKLLVYYLSIEEKEIKDYSRFEDLGADSLDMIDIITACEKEFGIKIPEDLVENITTVGQSVALLQNLIQ